VAASKSASSEAAVDTTAVSVKEPVVDLKSTAEPAHGFVSPLRAGWFNFYFADERWEWSPEVARIHGYEPGTVTPRLTS
jgi:hypothetical protein